MSGAISPARSRLTVLICFLVAIFEGIDLQSAGVAAPQLIPLFGLSAVQAGWFFSSSTFGLLIGAPVAGWLADRFGRKRMLVLSIATFGVFSLLTLLAWDYHSLLAARFATGLGLGGALPCLITIASETSSSEERGLAVALMYCGMPLGGAIVSLVAVVGGADWHLIFLLGGIGPLLLVPVVAIGLRDPHALRAAEVDLPPRAGPVAALFGEGRATSTMLLWVAFGFTLLVLYLLLNWLPSLLVSRGLGKAEASEVQIAFNVGGALGSVLVGWLIDRRDRRAVTAASFGITVVSLFVLAAIPAQVALAILVGALVGVGIMGNQALLYGLAPLCYPAGVRGTGVGAAVAAGRIGSLAGPLVAGQLLGAGQSAAEVIYAMLPIYVVGAIAALVLSARARASSDADDRGTK